VLLGAGTALVYRTLIAAMSDAVTPGRPRPVVGVYRFGRDSGSALGGIIRATVADALGYGGAIAVVAGITAASGLYDLPGARATRPGTAQKPRPDAGEARSRSHHASLPSAYRNEMSSDAVRIDDAVLRVPYLIGFRPRA